MRVTRTSKSRWTVKFNPPQTEMSMKRENEPLATSIAGYEVEIEWGWGRTCRFSEVERYRYREITADILKEAVLHVITGKIAPRFLFDCGRLDMPLSPYINAVRVTPVAKSETYHQEDILQNNLIEKLATDRLTPKPKEGK